MMRRKKLALLLLILVLLTPLATHKILLATSDPYNMYLDKRALADLKKELSLYSIKEIRFNGVHRNFYRSIHDVDLVGRMVYHSSLWNTSLWGEGESSYAVEISVSWGMWRFRLFSEPDSDLYRVVHKDRMFYVEIPELKDYIRQEILEDWRATW